MDWIRHAVLQEVRFLKLRQTYPRYQFALKAWGSWARVKDHHFAWCLNFLLLKMLIPHCPARVFHHLAGRWTNFVSESVHCLMQRKGN